MPTRFITLMAVLCAATPAMAQGTGNAATPPDSGNHANGLSYQPTPNEVVPRERADGIRPDVTQEKAENRELEKIDKDALRSVGQSTKSVPNFTKGQ